MTNSESRQGDVQTLIEAVRRAKECKEEYEFAKGLLGEATRRVQDLVGGDGLSAIFNGERRIGEILTRSDPPNPPPDGHRP